MRTKLRSLHLFGDRQFQDTRFDFTHPQTGDALDRICFIGSNGTGKSTLLRLLGDLASNLLRPSLHPGLLSLEIESAGQRLQFVRGPGKAAVFVDEQLDAEELRAIARSGKWEFSRPPTELVEARRVGPERELVLPPFRTAIAATDLVISSPAESCSNQMLDLPDVPDTNVSEALELGREFPRTQLVSDETIADMWRTLVYQIKRREEERARFETLPENLDRTKRELVAEFDRLNPEPLRALAALWNPLLEPAGLYFDADTASLPVQLTDNLKAYIKLRATNEPVPYRDLSTGMRSFLFKIGHIFMLYFNRPITSAFAFIDEPENSLFPDFLFTLMETYESLFQNTQYFIATHNPIVAAQFEPHERVVLGWAPDGSVRATRGVAPVGDDPNDLLVKDFGLGHLMGPKGQQAWTEYMELRKRIRRAKDEASREQALERAAALGLKYGFGGS